MERLFLRRRALVLLLSLSLVGCTGVFFQPHKILVRTPDHVGVKYEAIDFPSADGVKLHGWFFPARGDACGTVLFLHGNAENISTHFASVYWLPERGFNVFLPDYRGYGASEGTPTLAGLQADIEGAMRYLLSRPGIDTGRIVVFGQSLGGAQAIYYVAHTEHRQRLRALISDSAFSSYRDIAREKLGGYWLTWVLQYPLSWTISDEYSPVTVIPRVSPIPLLLVHGGADRVIPIGHAERLYAAAREPKEFWRLDGVEHIQSTNAKAVRERLVSYLREQSCPSSAASPAG
jgi:uncharacterized protein